MADNNKENKKTPLVDSTIKKLKGLIFQKLPKYLND